MGVGNGNNGRWTRREVLTRGLGVTGALLTAPAALAASTVEASAKVKSVNFIHDRKALRGSIAMAANNYTPSTSMVKTANNPVPHHQLGVLTKKYENEHPGVKIDLINVPTGNVSNYFRQWTVTQMVGNTEPDICETQSFDANNDVDAGKDWWTSMTKYLNEPNPYIPKGEPGAAKWIDEFYPAPTAAKQNANGNYYVMPFDLVTTFFYYNKNVFSKVGVQPPKTYTEFIHVLEKLHKAGHIAYTGMQWATTQMQEMCTRSWEKQVTPTGAGNSYTQKDVDVAIVKGIIKPDSEPFRDYLRLVKQSVPYWQSDWSTATANHAPYTTDELRFSQQQVAILEMGTWEFAILRSGNPPFKWGTFFMPTVEKGTGLGQSKYADGKPSPSIGGATSTQWGITKKARENGTVELCVDFLRYLSAPKQASIIINEVGQYLPNEKQATVIPSLRAALKGVVGNVGESGMLSYIGDWLPAQAGSQVGDAANAYYLGRADLIPTSQKIQQIYMTNAQQLVQQNGWQA